MNRREFLIQTGAATAGCMFGASLSGRAQSAPSSVDQYAGTVAIISDPGNPVVASKPVQWAVGELRQALTSRNFIVKICARLEDAPPQSFCVIASASSAPMVPDAGAAPPPEAEVVGIVAGRLDQHESLIASGSDARGLSYALTEVADAVALETDPWTALRPALPLLERPANRVRGVMRVFSSEIEDKVWFNDRNFWRKYLSLLASQRFNRFSLALGLGYDSPANLRDTYFHFAYPFFVIAPGYEVSVSNLTDRETNQNLEMLRFISDQAAERGLDFHLGLWNHASRWIDSPYANHVIHGVTPQNHALYCRDALALLLKECPNISGVTLRINEQSGVPEGSYDFWRAIFDGCVRSGRSVEIDLHPRGIDQTLLDAALATDLPVTLSPEYWEEHLGLPYNQAAIRQTDQTSPGRANDPFSRNNEARSPLRHGYGGLLREGLRYEILNRVWPGTQRLLLWGDPVFAAAYSRTFGFCGGRGCEIFDPLSFKGRRGSGSPNGRDGYADPTLHPVDGDFTKYAFTYRVWGRLLFNPDTSPEVWRRQLRHDYGPAAEATERSLGHASRILPLISTAHAPSVANANYWPEIYVNMSIVDASHPEPYRDTPSPKRFGAVSPLDPQLFAGIDSFADELLAGNSSGRYSPIEVAQWLEDLARTASESLRQASIQTLDRREPYFRRYAIDTNVQIGLGLFFSEKLRAGVLYAIYLRTNEPPALEAAIKTYRAAQDTWRRIVEVTAKAYVPDLTYGDEWFQRGHWSDRLAAIDKDIAAMERKLGLQVPAPAAPPQPPGRLASLIASVLGRPARPAGNVVHTPPSSFLRGQLVPLRLKSTGGDIDAKSARLFYRHVDQAEPWHSSSMHVQPDLVEGMIPADYAHTLYPLQYYFELTNASGKSWLYPGLGPDLTTRPYFVLR